jgi:phosphoribosylformylglycinamidine (FGAM) synthase PurS component
MKRWRTTIIIFSVVLALILVIGLVYYAKIINRTAKTLPQQETTIKTEKRMIIREVNNVKIGDYTIPSVKFYLLAPSYYAIIPTTNDAEKEKIYQSLLQNPTLKKWKVKVSKLPYGIALEGLYLKKWKWENVDVDFTFFWQEPLPHLEDLKSGDVNDPKYQVFSPVKDLWHNNWYYISPQGVEIWYYKHYLVYYQPTDNKYLEISYCVKPIEEHFEFPEFIGKEKPQFYLTSPNQHIPDNIAKQIAEGKTLLCREFGNIPYMVYKNTYYVKQADSIRLVRFVFRTKDELLNIYDDIRKQYKEVHSDGK